MTPDQWDKVVFYVCLIMWAVFICLLTMGEI